MFLSSTCWDIFCHRFVAASSYVVDDQRIGSSYDKSQSDRIIKFKSCSLVYCKSGILCILRIFLLPTCFAINIDVALSSKVFSNFDYVFLSVVLLTRVTKVISLKNKKNIFNLI